MKNPVIADIKPIKVTLEQNKQYYFCACGQSNNQPFCDGSHKNTEFTPQAFKAKTDRDAFLCQCKHSANKPYCDGSHKQFTEDDIAKTSGFK